MHCNQNHGLTRGQRILYWIVLVGMAMAIVGSFASRGFAIPSIVFVAVVYALVKTASLPQVVIASDGAAAEGRSPSG